MPRDIPVGNGSLLVNFDSNYQLRDLYWPHVGLENHTAGHPFRFGVWVDGQFSWVSQDNWQRRLEYEPATLVTNVSLVNNKLGLRLLVKDVVDFHENLYLRQITVHNDHDQEREIRLFFSHDFHIGGYEVGDSAYYEPERKALFHYKGKRWFLINAAKELHGKNDLGLDQWAVGTKEINGQEGTWRDAEDGWLSGNAVAQGSVDSTGALHLLVPGHGEAKGWYWIAVGEDFDAVIRINRNIRERGPDTYLERTRQYWKLWADKEPDDALGLSPELTDLYRRSLLIVRSQIDNDGAIIAANDYDITTFARDTYSYMWPRDGALVSAALIDAGYSEVTRRFFEFCHNVITSEGYLLHKYTPDGALASSWHAWFQDGKKQLPVQEDESALVIWALWKHFERFRDVEFVKPLYRGLITRIANWLTSYRDVEDGLPLPSWDLWEERRGVLSWTVAATWAGLQAAGNFADAFGETHLPERYRKAAAEIKAGVEKHLWRPEMNRFVRMINRNKSGIWDVDTALDSSLFGLWYFGMFPADDSRIVSTMKAIQDHLWIKTDVGGVARYENDYYHQVTDDKAKVPGNPWFICTLWLAEWQIAVANSKDDLKPALDILNWTARHTLTSGIMAEQVHPYSGAPLSVSPLTWSHATLVLTIRELLAKQNSINLKKKE
ncbi:MAG: glycoside hydrolase family 15 protein [Anaerolineales bacterium]|nr:glycoside hydrolase family 15 protein [Anaerolineales bacterium]